MIQRDEETAQAKLFYAKLPDDIASRYCLLLDPMLGTRLDVLSDPVELAEPLSYVQLLVDPQSKRLKFSSTTESLKNESSSSTSFPAPKVFER